MLRKLLPKKAQSLGDLPGNTANQQQLSYPSGGVRRLGQSALVLLLVALIPLTV